MKHILTSILLLAAFTLRSQTVSNVTAELIDGKVSVHYTLQSDTPSNCFLSYSADGGRSFKPCINVSGDLWSQSSGNKTIVWNHIADNVLLGTFFFKVEAIKVEQTQPAVVAPVATTPIAAPTDGVVINGVRWATRNVDKPGTFAANPEDAGMFYQWNRKTGWSSANPLVNSDGRAKWNKSDASGNTWEKANDPSPAGWRVPTREELQSLANETYVTCERTTENGINGYRFTDKATGNALFLPAAGYLKSYNGSLDVAGLFGYYWSSTPNDSHNAYNMNLSSGNFGVSISYMALGHSVRCVADE